MKFKILMYFECLFNQDSIYFIYFFDFFHKRVFELKKNEYLAVKIKFNCEKVFKFATSEFLPCFTFLSCF
jgi:hypothetical protein